jgi:hypothetical protein
VRCPRCDFDQPDGATDCARCGIVFAKWKDAEEEAAEVPSAAVDHRLVARAVPEEKVEDGRIGASEARTLAIGLGLAIVVYVIPFLRFVFSAVLTLFHELGHAVVGWLLGHPSLPAFDFVYGGGFTHQGQFHLSIAVAVAAGAGYIAWLLRRNRRALIVLGIVFAVWLLFVTREWRREIVIAAAGHAGEFVLGAIFFYRALTGSGLRLAVEKPLSAFIAFFVQINLMGFCWKLMHDADFLSWYLGGKAGGGELMNDLEIVALDLKIYLGIDADVPRVACWMLVFSVVPIAIALLLFLNRRRATELAESLLTP